MEKQKIQHRLGKYQVIGHLSCGSTSNVFKVIQIPNDVIQVDLTQIQNRFQLIEIDMEYNRSQTQQTQNSGLLVKKGLILKLYNLERILTKQNQITEQAKFDIFVQILFLIYLEHPGIVRAKQMLLQYQKTNQSHNHANKKRKLIKVGVIMQICQKGSFDSIIKYINRTKVLKQNRLKILKFYLSQVANTLMYLNIECGVLHRDLKSENIMVNKQLDIKVIDYGVSKMTINYLEKIFNHPQKQTIFNFFGFEPDITSKQLFSRIQSHQNKRKNLVGSRHYISPQLVQKYKSDMELIDQAYQKTDIWSFGVFMYKVFHERYPFEGRNLRETLQFIIDEGKVPLFDQDLPHEVRQVIMGCLTKDYTQRYTWKQIMDMDFFREMPINQIFSIESPIISILEEHRKINRNNLSNIEKVLFDQILTIKHESQANRKRRVLIHKQKNSKYFKMLIIKQKQSVSFQLLLTDPNCLKIQQEDKYLMISQKNNTQSSQLFRIGIQCGKQLVQKLIQSINEAFKIMESEVS